MRGGPIYVIKTLGKMAPFREVFSGKMSVCSTLTVLYSIYKMVGVYIQSQWSNYLGTLCLGN